jgi:2-dehydropantoate 2-reductase
VRTPLDQLVVERGTEGRRIEAPVQWTRVEDARPVDVAIVALKTTDGPAARPWLAALAPDLVVAVMNGVEHEARVGVPLVPALSYTAVERVAPGHLIHRAGNELVVATGGEAFAALFESTALRVSVTADFRTAAWRKLLSNLAGNPLTALTGARAAVFSLPSIRALALGLLREGAAAGRAEGAALADDEPERTLAFYDALPPDAGSSMLYDRLAGRPLEHDALTGAVVRAAERHGFDVPLNRAILALCEGLDAVVTSEVDRP